MLMITLVVMCSSICWGGWDLGRNGRVGFILVFLLFTASLVIHEDKEVIHFVLYIGYGGFGSHSLFGLQPWIKFLLVII